MLHEDYIMRMINQMVAVLARLTRLKETEQYQSAQELIDQSLEQLLGIKPQLLNNMEDASILNLLSSQGELGTQRLYILAELYRHEGDILMAQNRIQEAFFDHQRALTFYLHLPGDQNAQRFPDINQKIAELYDELQENNLPVDILYQIFNFFERNRAYALNEGVIARMLEAPQVDAHIIENLVSYYEGLLESGEPNLKSGGLTKAQVNQNLSRLKI